MKKVRKLKLKEEYLTQNDRSQSYYWNHGLHGGNIMEIVDKINEIIDKLNEEETLP